MRWIAVVVLAGCWNKSPPPSSPPPPQVHVVTSQPALPCGVASADELVRFADQVGSCTITGNGTSAYLDVIENGRVVLTHGEAKPTTAYDRRIEGPHGIRFGMTGGEILARLPGYRLAGCSAFDGKLQCAFHIPGKPGPCESFKDPNAAERIYVWLPVPDAVDVDEPPDDLTPLLLDVANIGVVLAMPC
jgi:hypothetical protein